MCIEHTAQDVPEVYVMGYGYSGRPMVTRQYWPSRETAFTNVVALLSFLLQKCVDEHMDAY